MPHWPGISRLPILMKTKSENLLQSFQLCMEFNLSLKFDEDPSATPQPRCIPCLCQDNSMTPPFPDSKELLDPQAGIVATATQQEVATEE